MKIRLALKLFGAFFLILAIVVGAMAFSRHLVEHSFRDYVRQVDLERLEALVPLLRASYLANNGWQGIANDPQAWQRLLHMAMEGKEHLRPLPSGVKAPAPPPPPPEGAPGGDFRQIWLVDDQLRPVFGRSAGSAGELVVDIDVNGRIVGKLGLNRDERMKSGPPADLMKRQTRQFYLVGGIVVAVTALIAFLFSRHLLKPVRRLTEGTRQLANRNFAVRIRSTTRDELDQLAGHFNQMAETLEAYEKMRCQWLTDISHELRTPLAVLRGEIEALEDGVREPTPGNLASLHAEVLRLGKLVEDLHLLSMADSDRLFIDKQRVILKSVLEDVLDRYRNRMEQCRIACIRSLEDIRGYAIEGDADRLEQVFANILENACRYAQASGTLEITGTAANGEMTIRFQDSGPGVPEKDLARLFDRLYRVDPSRSRGTGGSGLGLSICRHIVRGHGGRIWAEKSPLGGLSVCLTLPLGVNHGQ
ncbi:ATP-binding protein [uncultured Desulfosarcina sp.]|uniref:ATP-binding protein n=1 Tax=uncultured Desulfosarcina sp. TaxID=218289 RepID=UPI0029C7FD4D|nr:ATP-binding protein [uncultured Desulfosarcina sp.]